MALCECGCGDEAPIAKRTNRGVKKGDYQRFIRGHANRKFARDGMKRCSKCNQVLPIEKFIMDSRGALGRTGRCRDCLNLQNRRYRATLRGSFFGQKNTAKGRGIPFLLTFEEWFAIWKASGKLNQRGTSNHQYVMARFGDEGPYAVDNVQIVTALENQRQKIFTAEQREKLAAAQRGKRHSEETRKKMRESQARRDQKGAKSPCAKRYICTDSNGRRFVATGLAEFCRKHGLDNRHMSKVAKGKSRQHKGWTCAFA